MKISENQNTLTTDSGREYRFVETENTKGVTSDCEFCDLHNTDACLDAPCGLKERRDGKEGYFREIN